MKFKEPWRDNYIMSSESMAADEALSIEQAVYLYPENEPRARTGQITEITDEYIAITMAMDTQEYLNTPSLDDAFRCAVTGDNCVYRFAAAYRSSTPLPDQIWYITKPVDVERQQQRRFVRVPAQLPMRVKLTNNYGGLKNAMETTMVDISGNGVCFVSEKETPVDGTISIEIPDLPIIGTLQTEAIVKRCDVVDVPSGQVYHIGAYLGDNLRRGQEDKLIRCVFELQRKYLERGMGII